MQPTLEHILCLDFEASELGLGSYPIEAALVDCQSTACTSWLIRPTDDWLTNGVWSDEAYDVHKIALAELMSRGQPSENVARELEARCTGKTILCDGGAHDWQWLVRLFQTIGRDPPFELSDHSAFVWELAERCGRRPDIAVSRSEFEALSRFPALHRAGPDARRLAEVARLLVGLP